MDYNVVLILLVAVAAPGLVLIFLVYLAQRGVGSIEKAKKVRKYLLGLLTFCFIGLNVFIYFEARHVLIVNLEDKYQIQFVFHEQESFLDWPIEVDAEISSLVDDYRVEIEFNCDGPFLEVLTDGHGGIWIRGFDSNEFVDKRIQMTPRTLQTDFWDPSTFVSQGHTLSSFGFLPKKRID